MRYGRLTQSVARVTRIRRYAAGRCLCFPAQVVACAANGYPGYFYLDCFVAAAASVAEWTEQVAGGLCCQMIPFCGYPLAIP